MKLGLWRIFVLSVVPMYLNFFTTGAAREQRVQAHSSYFKRHESRRLASSANVKATKKREYSSMGCAFTCSRMSSCLSFNFERTAGEDGRHACEILSVDRFNNSQAFKYDVSFDHFSLIMMQFPCMPNPCLNGGRCVSLHGNAYACICAADYTGRKCNEVKYPKTCMDRYERFRNITDKAYKLEIGSSVASIFCHMTNISGCGGGGWTLVMKIDGSKSTFSYNSTYWSNKQTYNLAGGATGLDNQETKLPSYWNTPFTKLCLGMKVRADTRFILLQQQATSLYSLIADGQHRATSLGRKKWKSLLDGSSLQMKCGREGFNVQDTQNKKMVRIGIIGNNEPDCDTADSFLGFGSDEINLICGNFAAYYADSGDKKIAASCYIFLQ